MAVQELAAASGAGGPWWSTQRKFSRGTGRGPGPGASGSRWPRGLGRPLATRSWGQPGTWWFSQWPIPGGPGARKTFGFVAATSGVVPTAAGAPGRRLGVDEVPGLGGGAALHPGPRESWDQACIASVANDPRVLEAQPWRRRANRAARPGLSTAYVPHPGRWRSRPVRTARWRTCSAGSRARDVTLPGHEAAGAAGHGPVPSGSPARRRLALQGRTPARRSSGSSAAPLGGGPSGKTWPR